MNRYSLFTILLCSFAPLYVFANKEPYIDNQEVITKELTGLIISGDHFYPPEYILKTTKGALFYRTFAPKSSHEQVNFLRGMEKKLLGKSVTYADIEKYKEEVANFFLKHCNKYVFVELQAGGLDPSILVLKVVESKVGEVLVTGNNWFSEEFYKNNIGLFPNSTIDGQQLKADVDRINRSAWSKAQVVFHKGKDGTEIDVELLVEDSKPVRFYSGANNTGVDVLGSARVFAGGVWRSTSVTERALSFEYEINADFKNLQSYKVDYTFPFRDICSIQVEANYSHLKDLDGETGTFISAATSYDVPLPQNLKHHQNLSFLVGYKGMNNDFLSGGTAVSSRLATILQLGSTYESTHFIGPHELNIEMLFCGQPFGLSSKSTYSQLREGASTRYMYGRGSFSYQFGSVNDRTPSINIKGGGQISSARLLPSEQFGLGGMETVRGYQERAFNADSALFASLEIQSPKISLMQYVAKKYRHIDKLYGSIFVDAGEGIILHQADGEKNNLFLLGVGPSLRYDILDSICSRLDLGVRLGRAIETSDARLRLYFSTSGTF